MPVYCDYCEAVIDREEARTLLEGKDVCLGCLDLIRPIASRHDVLRFVTEMARRGWVYHWDDDPRDIQQWKRDTGEEVDSPTEEQLDAIEDRVYEVVVALHASARWG
jgi:hypothetical protein